MKVSEVLNPSVPPAPEYEAAKQHHHHQTLGVRDGKCRWFYYLSLYQTFGANIDYTFTGKDLFTIKVKGEKGGDLFPRLVLKIGNKSYDPVRLESESVRTLSYLIEGITGKQRVELTNLGNNGDAHPPNGRRGIYVGSLPSPLRN